MRLSYPLLALAVCAAVHAARADTIYMKDGRKLEGKVLAETEDTVKIKLQFGATVVKRADIQRIDKPADNAAAYQAKAAKLSGDDAAGHYQLGLWCKEKGMSAEAQREFEVAIAADANHAESRRELGFTQVGGKWVKEARQLKSARALRRLGRLQQCMALLQPLVSSKDEQSVRKPASLMLAEVMVKQGKWDSALGLYQSLEELELTDDERTVVRARRDILAMHPDGMYVVSPEASAATGKKAPEGMQSLSSPEVMQAALVDKARAIVEEGKVVYEKARSTDVVSPDDALKLYEQADGHFSRANLLSKDIARSFRIEIARKLIAWHDKKTAHYGTKFMAVPQPTIYVRRSGKMTSSSKKKWQTYVEKRGRYLDYIQTHYKKMLQIAQPYPDELAETIGIIKKWDAKIKQISTIMKAERKREGFQR